MASNRKNTNLNNIKMQAANELGVPLKDNGDNGDLTSRQAGSVGGQMVKKMMPKLRHGNQYNVPDDRQTMASSLLYKYCVHRTVRKNIEYDLLYYVYLCV